MSYNDIKGHQRMVFDNRRNVLYAEAIRLYTKPGSVVMDLGAGLGLFGFIAAKCGARDVHLVEPAPLFKCAEAIASKNPVDTALHFHNCRIEEADIPEKIDLLISVFTGNFLLTEDLLPSLFHARDKCLSSTGRMIPDRATMNIVPVQSEPYFQENVGCWSADSQDIDFSEVRRWAANRIHFGHHDIEKLDFLAETTAMQELDLTTATSAACDEQIEIEVTSTGTCHGFLGWFDIRLGEKWLSTSPTSKRTHWSQAFMPLDPPLQLNRGQKIRFSLKRPEFGEWTWSISTEGEERRHSTFLSLPFTPQDLMKKSGNYRPSLDRKGKIALEVLRQLNGEKSTGEITQELAETYPETFKSREHAQMFVSDIVQQFS